jgi:tRNA(Ile)-lysidine synthase
MQTATAQIVRPVTPDIAAVMSAIGYFEPSPTLAVAVSGGADSMALLLLAQEWTEARGGQVVALTVDHGLRSGSAQEAQTVAKWCRELGIAHYILTWKHDSLPASGIQARAREARYALLTDWCNTHGVLHLLTAHHQGDQAETLFMRVGRASRMEGLACMPFTSTAHGIRLLRPLLGESKAALESHLLYHRQPWINDPSNEFYHYTRNRLRARLQELTDYPRICRRAEFLTNQFGNIRNQLENKVAIRLTDCIYLYPEGYALFHIEKFLAMPVELAARALSSLIQTVGGHDTPPRLHEVEDLYQRFPLAHTCTFGGCILQVQAIKGHILVRREPRAIAPPVTLSPSQRFRWDGRFEVTTDLPGCTVAALGTAGVKMLPEPFTKSLPKAVLATLPAFFHLEEPVAVPHIDYRHPGVASARFSARFRPAKALAAEAFFSMNGER